MLEKLSGYKTYIFTLAAVAWALIYLKVPGAKAEVDADTFKAVLVALLGGAGISLKAAQARLDSKVDDVHATVKAQADPAEPGK